MQSNVLYKSDEFDNLYDTMWPKVYKFIYYKVQNIEEAEELTQDVFHRIYKQLLTSTIDSSKINSYLYTTARNIVNDLWRKKYRNPKIIYLDDASERDMEDTDICFPSEDIYVIKQCLSELKPEEKDILLLRIVDGYSIEETSKLLNKPIGTIKSMQYRAIVKLRERLSKNGFFQV